jgi:RNA polymerase sigma-70 factor, ECF subfamily
VADTANACTAAVFVGESPLYRGRGDLDGGWRPNFFRAHEDFPSYEIGEMIAPEGLAQLVRQAQAGDRQAAAELLDCIGPALSTFAATFDRPSTAEESTSDFVQEASLRFWEKLPQFRGSTDDAQTAAMLHEWLRKMVRRFAATRRQARHADKRRPATAVVPLGAPVDDSRGANVGIDPAASGPSPSALARTAEFEARVRVALNAMPEPLDRQILELCFVHSLSLRQVAERLHLSYDKVRERYHAGLRFLQRELEGLV